MTKKETVDKIVEYESGNMSKSEIISFFQELVDSGLAWNLQGHYGRMANELIQSGYVHIGNGEISVYVAVSMWDGVIDNLQAFPDMESAIEHLVTQLEGVSSYEGLRDTIKGKDFQYVDDFNDLLEKFHSEDCCGHMVGSCIYGESIRPNTKLPQSEKPFQ